MSQQQLTLDTIFTESHPFWHGLENNELLLQHCETCNEYIFYPRVYCPKDFSTLNYKKASGHGKIITMSIVVNTPDPRYKELTPFIAAVVELDEGPALYSRIVTDDLKSVQIGQSVLFKVEKLNDKVVPVFTPF